MQSNEPETLPDVALHRLRAIRRRAEGERAIRGSMTDAHRAAVERETSAREQLARHRQWMGRRVDDPNDVRLSGLASVAAGQAADLKQQIGALRTSTFPGAVEQWLKRLSSGTPLKAHVTKFAPRRGEAAMDVVERLRGELATLRAELHETRSSPVTSAEAKAIARDQVDFLAGYGAPGVLGCIHAGNPPTWPDVVAREGGIIHRQGAFSVPGIFAFVAWACRDQIIEKLEREIDDLSDDSVSLDVETRRYREAELLAKILDTERAECAAIQAAEEQGATLDYRDDTDLRAALNLADNVEVK